MMRLIVQYQDVLLSADVSPKHPLEESGVALHITCRLHKHLLQRTRFGVCLRIEDSQQTGRYLTFIFFKSQVPLIASSRCLRPNSYRLARSHQDAALFDFGSICLHALRFEDVSVCDQYPTLRKLRHEAFRHQVPCPIDACLAAFGL